MALAPKKSAAPAAAAKPKKAAQPASLDDYIDEVKRRAYEIYVGRGGNPGAEISDWTKAEKEIKAKYGLK
ncbi:MAG: DUF2934 domain-containing protein [Fibrobacterota bacterium]